MCPRSLLTGAYSTAGPRIAGVRSKGPEEATGSPCDATVWLLDEVNFDEL